MLLQLSLVLAVCTRMFCMDLLCSLALLSVLCGMRHDAYAARKLRNKLLASGDPPKVVPGMQLMGKWDFLFATIFFQWRSLPGGCFASSVMHMSTCLSSCLTGIEKVLADLPEADLQQSRKPVTTVPTETGVKLDA